MAYAATAEGLARVRESDPYKNFMSRTASGVADEPEDLVLRFGAQAVAYAVRRVHAEAAAELSVQKLPGTDRFLFEP
jgi:hypothetical protein